MCRSFFSYNNDIKSAFTISKIINLFKNCPPAEQCVDTAPVDVKGGEVYIFKIDDTNEQGEVAGLYKQMIGSQMNKR